MERTINQKLKAINKKHFKGRTNPVLFCKDCNYEHFRPNYCDKCATKFINRLNKFNTVKKEAKK